jgi:predicted DNA-binding protein
MYFKEKKMPTQNPRINITFEEETFEIIKLLAKRAHTSIAGITRKLVLDAIEMDEDFALSKLADKRLLDDAGKKTISHEEAWKDFV